ncbi:MAG: PAS domain S-box protein [Chloroflexi bacterium]|nr:PAS domain S-box protein [Chloroflexota bacterium]
MPLNSRDIGADELKGLLNLAPVAVIVRSFGSDTIVYWSRGAEDLYGWAAAEVGGQVTHTLLRTHFPISKETVDAQLGTAGSWSGELVHIRRNGQAVVVASRQAVQRDAQGQPTLTLEINSDITERKLAETRLRESEERFRLLVDSVQDYAIFLLSADARVMTWNEGAQRLKGFTPEEIIGHSFTRFYSVEDVQRGLPYKLLERATAEGRVEHEGWRIRKDGSRFWANVTITALRDQAGELRGFAKITRDLTERKASEDARAQANREEGARLAAEASQEELRASRDQLATILAGVDEGVMAQDPQGRVIYANTTAAQMCGFSDGQLLQRASVAEVVARFEVFDESGRQLLRSELPAARVLRGEIVPETTLRFRTPGDPRQERWSVVHATAVRAPDGSIQQVISIFRDVTERKWAEDTAKFLSAVNLELTRSLDYEATLARVAELAVPGLADWCLVDVLGDDRQLHRLAVAHRDPAKVRLAEELARRYPDQPAGAPGASGVLRTGRVAFVEQVSDEMIQTGARDADHLAILRGLHIRSVIVAPLIARGLGLGTITLATSESGRRYEQRDVRLAEDLAVRAAVAVDNARLYREAQEQAATHVELNQALREAMTHLEQNLRTRDEFLASAAHDLKNPLASIKGLAQLLERRVARAEGLSLEAVTDGLARIDSVATRATNQVDELLDVARLQMGRALGLDLQPTDLVELARDAVTEHAARTQRHEVTFQSDVPELVGLWDRHRLSRVFDNLLDNAVKYSPEGGLVSVRVTREASPSMAVVVVEDAGVGIHPDDLARIFQRFERGVNVVGEIVGTGIGLVTVKHVVESHGGTVTASSQPHQGTTFTIRLPLTAAADASGVPDV